MSSKKEGEVTLRNVATGAVSTRDFKTKDKHEMPIYDFFLAQGVSRLGSGSVDAGALFDGDPDTFWEPDPDDPIERWWIEIDLGRTVLVDELVLRFAEEGNGDAADRGVISNHLHSDGRHHDLLYVDGFTIKGHCGSHGDFGIELDFQTGTDFDTESPEEGDIVGFWTSKRPGLIKSPVPPGGTTFVNASRLIISTR